MFYQMFYANYSQSGMRGSGRSFLVSWIIVTTFITMAFNCNLRACLIQKEHEKPVGKIDIPYAISPRLSIS